jgi:hypothetical protein
LRNGFENNLLPIPFEKIVKVEYKNIFGQILVNPPPEGAALRPLGPEVFGFGF